MFVVIDGPDGSGKTTLAKAFVNQLLRQERIVSYTFEPTYDSTAGMRLREMMRSGNIEDIYSFADLFVEDRKEHIRTYIAPALARGETVVCDRYKYSALAYQQLQGVDALYLIERNRECLIPDLIFIMLPHNPDILVQRIRERGNERDMFENRDFLTQTLLCYQKLPDYFPGERIIFLNAEVSISQNINRIMEEYYDIKGVKL